MAGYEGLRKDKYAFYWDASAGDGTWVIQGPKGKKGRLLDYGLEGVTTTYTNTTTAAIVKVGKSGALAVYGAAINYGATATANAVGLNALAATADPAVLFSATYILLAELPADTPVYLTAVAPTGGSPAGKGTVFMWIGWAD